MFEAAPPPGSLKLAIAALAVLAALGFMLLHRRARQKALRAASWPVVPGVVMSSRTASRWGFGNGVWAAGLWYVPLISYRYEVDGKSYTGSRIFLSDTGFSQRKRAAEFIARYPAGSEVAVHYDPSDPRRASLQPVHLERRALGTAILLFIVAVATLMAG